MKRVSAPVITVLITAMLAPAAALSQVSIFSTDELRSAITNHDLDISFILIDVRNRADLSGGIIASKYCRPYHLAWNNGDFRNAFRAIPADFPVMLYDQTGALAMQAAKMLVDSGYTVIAAIAGGVNAYDGELEDTTYFITPGLLPHPSYFGDLSSIASRRASGVCIRRKDPGARRNLTLQGRMITRYATPRYRSIIVSCDKHFAHRQLRGFTATSATSLPSP